MNDLNPYKILAAMFTSTNQGVNIPLKEEITITLKPKSKKKPGEIKTILRNKKDSFGNEILRGGEKVEVYKFGSIEIHMDHDSKGRHMIALHDPATGSTSQRILFVDAYKMGTLKRLANGRNVWAEFGF